ncbi:DUF998 domain-containing protein [Actinokineospora pegani]|uniref:DUF998 domain-containing protein n=1 Tax=Actinokineospora pegani TaxID=2654637 RepID=UPI0012E9FA10|nr:DUF998 domain-containing protein [Actinokineospora pegani]
MRGTLVHSYLFLRRAIGVIGLLLPVVLIVGGLLADGGLAGSISGYYHGSLRDVFVGAMCAVGVFLISYRGYDRVDEVVGNVAAVAAIGVALFPTAPADADGTERVFGVLHLVFAGVFFLALAFFCLVLFRRSDDTAPTPRKRARNGVYLACGLVIVASLVLIALCALLGLAEALRPALWLETAAILAFGLAWLTKGEAVLADLEG